MAIIQKQNLTHWSPLSKNGILYETESCIRNVDYCVCKVSLQTVICLVIDDSSA